MHLCEAGLLVAAALGLWFLSKLSKQCILRTRGCRPLTLSSRLNPCAQGRPASAKLHTVIKIDAGWHIRNAANLDITGSFTVYDASDQGWLPAAVPGTALAALVAGRQLPDPYVGAQNIGIPDVYHHPGYYTFLWRTSLQLPALFSVHPGQQAWLWLNGINYSIRAWLNGQELALPQPGGMYLRRQLLITSHVLHKVQEQSLLLLIQPPECPGCVDRGGQGGDHMIAKNVTAQFAAGWDWIQPVRDRNTGIWDTVEVHVTGPACMRDPHIQTMQINATTPLAAAAILLVSVTVQSTASTELHGRMLAEVRPKSRSGAIYDAGCTFAAPAGQHALAEYGKVLRWEEAVVIGPHEETVVRLAEQVMSRPALWWPIHMGQQALYELHLELHIDTYGRSAAFTEPFGVRRVQSVIDSELNGHTFYVNGCKMFIRGGNYIVADAMMRATDARLQHEVAMHADMGLNMIRLWGGCNATRPAFLHACDALGILVWWEFWITGDCMGRGATKDSPISDPNWPVDHALFLACAADTIRRVRNHPCIALWCGGNEQVPCPALNAALRRMLPCTPSTAGQLEQQATLPAGALDVSRAYVPGSLWCGFGAGTGAFSDGPYGIQNPEDFFQPGYYPYAFNPEVGSVGVPVAETLQTMFDTEQDLQPPRFAALASGDHEETASAVWRMHTHMEYGSPGHVPNQICQYGVPQSLEEYADQAQIANYEQYRALLEGWAAHMWQPYTGMLIWKTQNPWTGLRGQLYDCRLQQTGGYFGAKLACQPLHVQLNPITMQVQVVNTQQRDASGLVLEWQLHGLSGDESLGGSPLSCSQTVHTDAPADSCVAACQIDVPWQFCGNIAFLFLRLWQGQRQVSRNVYWLKASASLDFHGLRPWCSSHAASLQVSQVVAERAHGFSRVRMHLTNAHATHVAFWIRMQVQTATEQPLKVSVTTSLHRSEGWTGQDVLPTYYSDNYITLAATESVGVHLSFQMHEPSDAVAVLIKGWNTQQLKVELADVFEQRTSPAIGYR